MRKIVLTGGPCSGKTTVLEHLRASGCATAPEAAIQVIRDLTAELGLDGQRAWRDTHWVAFQERVARLQIEHESAAERGGAEILVCDRGLLDGLAYCRHRGVEPPTLLLDLVRGARYDQVFVLDTLKDFDARLETGRVDDRDDSLRVGALIRAVYTEHGYRPVRVPELSVETRAARILKHARKGSP
jgi:predicted ATPase